MALHDSSLAIRRPSQPHLDLDCMRAVIDNVTDHFTLLSLLTVSRDVFHIAVQKLYSAKQFSPRYSVEGTNQFTRFILSLSPIQDELTTSLRQELQIPWPRAPPPTIDYLSLVHELKFHPIHSYNLTVSLPSSTAPVTLSEAKIRCMLVWAVCGHRLSEVEAIQFEDREELELFGQHVNQLSSLRRIALGTYWDGVWTELQAFVNAYSVCHGEASRRLSFWFGQGPGLTTTIVETMALFSPLHPPKEIKSYNLPQCTAHLDFMDFGRVKGASVDHSTYAEEVDLWSQLLPKCSSLRYLEIRGLRSEKRIFHWAVQARRAGRSLAPLKALKLKFCNFILYPTVNDLLEGFGLTLETVKIRCGWDNHWLVTPFDTPQPRIASGLYLPNLRILEARVFSPYVFAFDPDCMPVMPRLEVLKLDHAVVQGLEDYSGSTAQYDESIDIVFPLKTWPFCEFSQLRVLCLTGRPAAEFNPRCFQTMTRLEELALVLDTANWSDYWPTNLWTWDWELPALKTIALGQLMASNFRFKALCYMPNIESVILGGMDDRDANFEAIFNLPIHLDDESESNDEEKGNHASGSVQRYPGTTLNGSGIGTGGGGGVLNNSITSIDIECDGGFIELAVWRKLLSGKAFPNLRSLHIGGYAGVHDTAIVREASRHPRLRELWISKPEHDEMGWPADQIDEEWERGGVGRTDDDGHIVFYVNCDWYRIPKIC